MDIFRKYLAPSVEVGEDAGSDVVETLVDRFQTATRVEDRRDSMRGIKALSKRYRLEVGTQAMLSCIEALSRDSEDPDTVSYALDTLCNIMNDEGSEIEPHDLVNIPPDLGKQFTEIFIKESENVQLVLSSLSSYDMPLRRQTIQLLILMLQNNRKAVQDILLNSPMAISKFMASLCDPMEAIRNDGILLLLYFTKCHVTIQKIVAFENVFERILSIVEAETLSDGGVVIEDCFRLLHQLLSGNKQNQILFKDGRFIQHLAKLFEDIPGELVESCTFSAQKLANIDWLLKILRCLVSPSNKAQHVRGCQIEMESCGLLLSLWKVVMAGGVPADLLTKTLYTLGETVRGCPSNQHTLVSLVAPSEPPQPAITVLLVTMVNERQQLAVRLAVLYCFQCILASNAEIQRQVVATLLPRECEPCVTSAGQLLCGGLFSQDCLTVWFSAIALLHSINNSTSSSSSSSLKESLLQVHMAPATGGGGTPVTLMQQCFRLVCQTSHYQAKLGLLQFLCVWMAQCPAAVHAFLSLRSDNNFSRNLSSSSAAAGNSKSSAVAGAGISHLLADVSSGEGVEEIDLVSSLAALLIGICVCYNQGAVEGYDSKSLIKTIDRRIGIDDLVKRVGQIFRSDDFIKALKDPEPQATSRSDLVFDYEFTQVFKTVEFEVSTRFSRGSCQDDTSNEAMTLATDTAGVTTGTEEGTPSAQQQHAMLLAYQRAVAERDVALQGLQLRVIELERQLASATGQQPSSSLTLSNISGPTEPVDPVSAGLKSSLELEAALKTTAIEKETLKSEHEDLLLLLSDQDTQISELNARLEGMTFKPTEPSSEQFVNLPGLQLSATTTQPSASAARYQTQQQPSHLAYARPSSGGLPATTEPHVIYHHSTYAASQYTAFSQPADTSVADYPPPSQQSQTTNYHQPTGNINGGSLVGQYTTQPTIS